MTTLFTVAAPARSGTKWYAKLFSTPRSFCYHEFSEILIPYPVNGALDAWLGPKISQQGFELGQRRLLLQGYPGYFDRLWEHERFKARVIGNSDNRMLGLLPALYLLWPDMRFIFSVRNGINAVQSHYALKDRPPDIESQQLMDGARDYCEHCCLFWRTQIEQLAFARRWLAGRAACISTTLEEASTRSTGCGPGSGSRTGKGIKGTFGP